MYLFEFNQFKHILEGVEGDIRYYQGGERRVDSDESRVFYASDNGEFSSEFGFVDLYDRALPVLDSLNELYRKL